MVARIGNEISRASLSGVDVPRATFLQKDIILTEGVVFAYSAYYRSAKPVRFQIWRPMAGAGVEGDTYRLIAQTSVLPAVLRAREDVSVYVMHSIWLAISFHKQRIQNKSHR